MRKLTGAFILLLIALTGASVAVHMLVDQDALRQNIVKAVHRQTGMTLRMARSNVQLLPWPSFDAGGLELSRDGMPPVLTAQSVHAGIALFALLHREVRFQDFTVSGARLNLLRTADGTPNWVLAPQRDDDGDVGAPLRAGTRITTHWDASLDSLHLTNSTISWADSQSRLTRAFTIGLLDLAGLRSPSPWINLQGTRGQTPFTLQGHVGALSLLRDGSAPWTFSLGTSLGTAAHRDWINLDGLAVDAPHLRGLRVTAQGELVALRDLQALFPHAGLPDIKGPGGLVTLVGSADPNTQPVTSFSALKDILFQKLRPTRVHLHIASSTLPRQQVVLENIHVDADGTDARLSVEGDINWRGYGWRLEGRVGTLSDIVAAWKDPLGRPLAVNVDMRSQSLSLASALDMSGTQPPANAQDNASFHLEGMIGDPSSHLMMKGGAQALHLPGAVLHDVSLSATESVPDMQRMSMSGFELQSRELSVAGSLNMTRSSGSVPRVTANIHASNANLDALQGLWQSSGDVPKVKPLEVKPAASPASAVLSQVSSSPSAPQTPPVRNSLFDALHAVDLDAQLALDQAHFFNHDYTDLAGHLTLSGGHLHFAPVTGKDGDMPLSGTMDLDATTQPMTASLGFQPIILPASIVQRLFGIPVLLDGPTQIVGALSGTGETLQQIQQTLTGHLGLSIVGGTVNGATLAGLSGPAVASLLGTGTRPLRCFGVHMQLADQSATIDTFGLQSSRFSTVGSGRMGLVSHEITLHLVPSVNFAGAGASAPVLVTGVLPALHATQERDSQGSFELNIGGAQIADPCSAILRAARENMAGVAPPAVQPEHHSKAGDLLRALGVLH